jgi:hypothetical protein
VAAKPTVRLILRKACEAALKRLDDPKSDPRVIAQQLHQNAGIVLAELRDFERRREMRTATPN